MGQSTFDHRGGGAVEGAEADVGQFARSNPIDIDRGNLHFDNQSLACWNDIQQRRSRVDHATDRMHLQTDDHARLGGADLGALGPILYRCQAFPQVEHLRLHFGQLVDHFGGEVLVQLEDLQLGFADLQARPGDGGLQVGNLRPQQRQAALLLAQALLVDKSFFQQGTQVADFLGVGS
ncbi:hypothetical protein D3C78_1337670 [compost metagenome]